ncbi:MAG: NTP transferase domain-containing protein [Rubrivivax sp.]|jgi:D-glycero-alpha-D-manno-heptose 1-phosphate guanylyltransferase|nr:NTP transferase domain-containing protein [Rubrivivax sp.]
MNQHPITSAIVLAGGLGTRLRAAVPDLPKPMAPVAGRPFLAHQLDQWITQGIRDFVFAVGYRHEAISGYFGDHYRGATIRYSVEAAPLGTGGALLQAASMFAGNERFLLLNGDTYFDVALPALADFAIARDADWCFSLFVAAEPGRYMGMMVEADGRISALISDDQTPGRLANGGVYLVHPRSLHGAPDPAQGALSLENDLFAAWLAQGQRFHGMAFGGRFIDIGVPHDYHRAANVLPQTCEE